MTDTTLRRRREDIYGVAPGGAEYHAFFASTTGLFAAAFYDKNGVWVEDRGSVVDGSALSLSKKGLTLLIRSDEGGLVGDGTLAFWDKGGPAAPSLNVVDFEAGTSYREEVLSGDAIGFGAGYAAGFLWWIEHTFDFDANPTTVTFRLRRCRCDLSAIETVTEETIDLATGSGNPWHAWVESFSWFAMTQDAALAGFCAHNRASGAAGGTAGEVVARFPLNGDSGALAEHGRPTDLPRTVGVAAATVPAFLVGNPVTYDAGYDGLQRSATFPATRRRTTRRPRRPSSGPRPPTGSRPTAATPTPRCTRTALTRPSTRSARRSSKTNSWCATRSAVHSVRRQPRGSCPPGTQLSTISGSPNLSPCSSGGRRCRSTSC